MRTYYLNNTGHRFVTHNDDNRRAKYFEMLSNTTIVAGHYRGKLIKTFNYGIIS